MLAPQHQLSPVLVLQVFLKVVVQPLSLLVPFLWVWLGRLVLLGRALRLVWHLSEAVMVLVQQDVFLQQVVPSMGSHQGGRM